MDAQALAEVQEDHVRLDRKELLKIIQDNRSKHNEEHAVALKGWRKAYAAEVKAKVDEWLEAAAKVEAGGEEPVSYFGHDLPDKPTLHVKEYDRIIRRMELSKDAEIFLSHSDFDKFVLDEWKWTAAHRIAVTSYGQ